MKSLPPGNYALTIAHPGHELRLHGFLEQARPFVFILTDGSHRTGQDMMMDSIKSISKAIKNGIQTVPGDNSWNRVFMYDFPENQQGYEHVKDSQIYYELLNQRTDFFVLFINLIAKNLVKYKIDYLISDSSEGTNVCHEITRMMAEIAVQRVKKKTGKEIIEYDFAIDKPFNEDINDECIRIQLEDEAVERKLDAILKYQLALTDLKPNVSLDLNVIVELRKMPDGINHIKQMLKDINSDFFRNEYLHPLKLQVQHDRPKPLYETIGEKAVADGKYTEVITHEKHLEPLRKKLIELMFTPSFVK